MNLTADLFDPQRLARRTDPQTSVRAAEKAQSFIATHEASIFGAICDAGSNGATYREIAARTGMEPVAVARRLKGMEVRGLIVRNGVERDRCCVWVKA